MRVRQQLNLVREKMTEKNTDKNLKKDNVSIQAFKRNVALACYLGAICIIGLVQPAYADWFNVGTEEKKIRSRENLASELLKEGFIQSFIDMFYISHKCLPNVMSNGNYIGEVITSPEDNELSESDHAFLGDLAVNLKKAESFSYYNDTDKDSAMTEYNLLA